MKRLVLMITEKCNFRCNYCIQKEFNYSLDMSDEVLEKAISLFKKYWFEGKKNVDFFWWEPLLRRKQISNIIKNNKEFNYELTTNGSLLNSKIVNFFQINNVSIILSFDWLKWQINRKSITWEDTYMVVINSIKLLVDVKYENFMVNITPTIDTYDEIINELNFIYNLGVRKITADCFDYVLYINSKYRKWLIYSYFKLITNIKNNNLFTYNKLKSFIKKDYKDNLEQIFNTLSIAANGDIFMWENACHDRNKRMRIWNILENWEYIFSNYVNLVKERLDNDKDLLKVLSVWLCLSWIFDDKWNLSMNKFKNYISVIDSINKIIEKW